MAKKYIKPVIFSILAGAFFIFTSQLSQAYSDELKNILNMGGFSGMVIYVVLNILAIVIAPLSFGFLLPIAANVWGPFIAGSLSILAWSIGAAIAFFLARKYGRPLVKKFFSEKVLNKIEQCVPNNYTFFSIVFFRMVLPVDVLSYALGLFKFIKFKPYFYATIIGISPFSYIFSYSATLPIGPQIIVAVLGTTVFLWGGYIIQKKYKSLK